MGVLRVKHLAVLAPDFFNVLAARRTDVLQTDDVHLARQIKLRHFASKGEPLNRRLPITQIESFNSVPEQELFAMAAVRAGVAGRGPQRDLALLQNGLGRRVPAERQERLSETLGRLAALPKTRVRMPSGAQHLLTDTVESLLLQTAELNGRVLELGLAAYAPKGADLAFPNAQEIVLDRQDSLRQGGMTPIYLQERMIEWHGRPDTALMFNQLQALRGSGITIAADYAVTLLVPRTELHLHSGAQYLVTNPPEAVERALAPDADKIRSQLPLPPRKVLN